jgi:putative effector of murein hydrolase
MNQLFQDSVFFGVLISLAAYGIGMLLKLKTGWSLMNPLLSSVIPLQPIQGGSFI